MHGHATRQQSLPPPGSAAGDSNAIYIKCNFIFRRDLFVYELPFPSVTFCLSLSPHVSTFARRVSDSGEATRVGGMVASSVSVDDFLRLRKCLIVRE